MAIERNTDIFIETHRRFVIYQPKTMEQVFCPQCSEQMVTAEDAASLFKTGRRDIYRSVENDAAHFAETDTGVMYVCPGSLADNRDKKIEAG